MAPDPWLTFWLAVGGLVASLASGFGAVWALTQKRRYLPKPLMIGTASINEALDQESDPPSLWFSASVENKGDGLAHDVHLYLCNSLGIEREIEHQPIRAHGEVMRYGSRISKESGGFDEHGNWEETTGTGETVRLWARVTWRQAPRMEKVRSLVLRPSRPR